MPFRPLQRFVFWLERFIVQGAFHQLLFIALLIVLVSVLSGTAVFLAVPEFANFLDAVWWGFLRLSDPGYLGDDEGIVARTVSTAVTVLGYVLFMGALIAIMNQGLGRLMRRLESGVTPITANGHILILGWTNRTVTIIRELLLAKGRVSRFLRRSHGDRLRIVVMAEQVTVDLVYELKAGLGELWDHRTLILRSGNPLHTEHLERVDFLNAAAIILPGGDFGHREPEALDARLVKTMLSIANTGERRGIDAPPILTTELFDPRKIDIARAAYPGDVEIIPSSAVISRLIAQNVRHGGLSGVYSELLTHAEGNAIYMREFPELVGRSFRSLEGRFDAAIPLGVIRDRDGVLQPVLNPAGDLVVEENDRLVFIAQSYEAIAPGGASEANAPGGVPDGTPEPTPAAAPPDAAAREPATDGVAAKRVLILGWNHKLPILLSEFESYTEESFDVTVVSLVPEGSRRAYIDRFAGPLARVQVEHVEADYTVARDLRNLNPGNFDNVVFLTSERVASDEESDARVILGFLLLRTVVPREAGKPEVLIELIDEENQGLLANRPGETLVSPLIISHILAHVTLRRELWLVFEELFTAHGAEIYFRPSRWYGAGDDALSFREIQRLVAAHGDVALGVYLPDRGASWQDRVCLNPPRESTWTLSEGHELVVLTTYT